MRRSILLAAIAALGPAQPVEVSLGTRDAAIAEPFSDIVGIAELPDGRVVVSDRVDKSYFIADFRSGQRQVTGRNGNGPNEYQSPFGPIRWKRDTLLGFDPNHRRVLRIGPDGAIRGSLPFASPRQGGVTAWAPPRGVDAQGRVYWDAPVIHTAPVMKRSTKAKVLRWLPGTDSVEVVLTVADHAEFEDRFRIRPVPQADAWVVAADGRIGVVSAAEYRLRWYRDGQLVEEGPPVAYRPVRVTAAERDAFRARKALEPVAGAALQGGGAAGDRAAATQRVRVAWPDSIFPDHLPPFPVNGALLAPNGDVWVKRTGAATERAARVDILDAHGRLQAALRLPPRAELVALGAAWVYVVVTDADGFQVLERYGYPALPR